MIEVSLARSSVSFRLLGPDQDELGGGLPFRSPASTTHATAQWPSSRPSPPVLRSTRPLVRSPASPGSPAGSSSAGSARGVTFVDDYAHLPSEVRAALAAARDGGWQRVVAVFQPHRYTRTAELWEDFGPAFRGADVVVVTDVYGAGEAPKPGVTGQLVADAVRRALPGVPVYYAAGRDELRRRGRGPSRSRRPVLHPRRRRSDLAGRRVDGGAELVSER